ncbi:MAG: hypothetical protein ACTHN3_01880 [Solirubrobacterales bacterium]
MGQGFFTNHVFSKLGAIAALACVCALVVLAPAAAQSKQAGTKSCGDIPVYYTWDVKVEGVDCGKAKAIVKVYDRKVAANLEHKWKLNIEGFHCVLVKIFYNGDSHRCTAGGQEIRWWRGRRESS